MTADSAKTSRAKLENLNVVVDGERYRTATSYLLADDGETTFLFRALSSDYFVQRPGGTGGIEPVSVAEAERLYQGLPHQHEGLVAAFPKAHGGVGMDTATRYDDDDERERLVGATPADETIG